MRTALIRVGPTTEGYEAILDLDWDGTAEPAGELPSVRFAALPVAFGELRRFLVDNPGPTGSIPDLGRELEGILLSGGIRDALAAVKEPLRVLLDLPEELTPVPWELMRGDQGRTFTNTTRPVARLATTYVPDLEPPEMCWPLRVMVVVGSDDELIKADEEVEHVRDAFRKVCGLVDLIVRKLPTSEKLREDYETIRPHVFHFIGHGDIEGDRGYLRLDRERGGGIEWTVDDIVDDLREAPPRVAIINACHSGAEDEQKGMRAVAQGLAGLGVPAVIAMQGPISGEAAERFAKGFYEGLCEGRPLDVAMARARRAIIDVAPDTKREFAVPALTLGAPPEQILDLSENPREKLSKPLDEACRYVDRIVNRRGLWARLRANGDAGPRVFTVTGPESAGKGSLVRWCLGIASLWGHPVAFVTLQDDEGVDSVTFLGDLAQALAPVVEPVAPGTVARFRRRVADYERARLEAEERQRTPLETPLELYEALRTILAAAAEDATLVLGIDGIERIERGEWQNYAVPGLIKPIAHGQAGNVRLIVALHENERKTRFPVQHFGQQDIDDIKLGHFSPDEFKELVTQWLRAQDYVRASFEQRVEEMSAQLSKEGRRWTTFAFHTLQYDAEFAKWQREA